MVIKDSTIEILETDGKAIGDIDCLCDMSTYRGEAASREYSLGEDRIVLYATSLLPLTSIRN